MIFSFCFSFVSFNVLETLLQELSFSRGRVLRRRRLFKSLRNRPPPPPLHILLHCSFSLSHWFTVLSHRVKFEVMKIALPCFQFRFHTSSPYFVFRFFFSNLPISSSNISISVSFSFHLLLRSIFCFRFCPNFVSLFDFVIACDFATAK